MNEANDAILPFGPRAVIDLSPHVGLGRKGAALINSLYALGRTA
jgi:hypothetical protein